MASGGGNNPTTSTTTTSSTTVGDVGLTGDAAVALAQSIERTARTYFESSRDVQAKQLEATTEVAKRASANAVQIADLALTASQTAYSAFSPTPRYAPPSAATDPGSRSDSPDNPAVATSTVIVGVLAASALLVALSSA